LLGRKSFKAKKSALTVTEVSKRYELSKEIIYENLDTLNYIESPTLRYKIRLQDTNTTLPLLNRPLLINDEDLKNIYLIIDLLEIQHLMKLIRRTITIFKHKTN
jgi:hypothetical protein